MLTFSLMKTCGEGVLLTLADNTSFRILSCPLVLLLLLILMRFGSGGATSSFESRSDLTDTEDPSELDDCEVKVLRLTAVNGEQGEAESKSRGLFDLTVNCGWSKLETELCTDKAGDTDRLRSSKAFCVKFLAPGTWAGGGGVGEKESLLFEGLTRVGCEVAIPCIVEGVGEMESLLGICLIGIDCAVAVL